MNTETSSTKVTFSNEQLNAALFGNPAAGVDGIMDLFDRCALVDKMILLKDTAYQAKNGLLLDGDHLDVGIEKRYLIPEVLHTLKEIGGVEDPTKDFIIKYGEVPVHVKVITKPWKILQNLDSIVYQYEMVQVPNPFDKYWSQRFLVR